MPKYRTDPTRNSRHEADNGDRHENTKYRKDIFFNSKNICLIEIFVFSVVSWSARNESRSTQESSSWEVVQQQQQLEQHRSMQQHMQVMQQRETQRQVRIMIMVLIYTPLCCAAERELGEEEPGAPEPHGGEEAARPRPRPRPRAGGEPGAAPGAEAAAGGGAPGGGLLDIYIISTKYLPSPIQRQEVRSVIKKTQQETQETKREKVKQEAAVTIPVKNYRYLDIMSLH